MGICLVIYNRHGHANLHTNIFMLVVRLLIVHLFISLRIDSRSMYSGSWVMDKVEVLNKTCIRDSLRESF